MYLKVCIKIDLKLLKYTILLTSTKSHEASKIKASHYFGVSTKIAEHTIIKAHGNMAK